MVETNLLAVPVDLLKRYKEVCVRISQGLDEKLDGRVARDLSTLVELMIESEYRTMLVMVERYKLISRTRTCIQASVGCQIKPRKRCGRREGISLFSIADFR